MKASETNVVKLLQGSKVFVIPNFQRRYSWRLRDWQVLWNDLLREHRLPHVDDGQNYDGHFIGSVVLHPTGNSASMLMSHLVIDGQQRLTTILILLAAIRDLRRETEPNWRSNEYDDKYLTNPYEEGQPDRLLPTEMDRHAYTQTMRHGKPTDGIGQAYVFFRESLETEMNEGLILADFATTLLKHTILVEISTGPHDSVNNIFNTLNSKGKILTPADLVRNEMLLHVGERNASDAYHRLWRPMELALVKETKDGFNDRDFVTYLWSREVVRKPDTTRQDLFAEFEAALRGRLKQAETRIAREELALEIFEQLHREHLVFLFVRHASAERGEALGVEPELLEAVQRMQRWNSEPATPFVLWVVTTALRGHITQIEAAETLQMLLGYLVRRTLAGIATNTLNRLITPLANRVSSRLGEGIVSVVRELLSQRGYYWPTDAQVRSSIASQPLYISARRFTKWILEESERLRSSKEYVETASLTIEHVFPQSPPAEWIEYLASADAAIDEMLPLVHTLGNLTLTGKNSELGNIPFAEKRLMYQDSPLNLNRDLAGFSFFGPSEVQTRSAFLVDLLLPTLPGPTRSQPTELAEDDSVRLIAALQSLPEGRWTTDYDLIEYLGIERDEVRALVNALSPVLARLVRGEQGGAPDWFTEGLALEVANQTDHFELEGRVGSDELGKLSSSDLDDDLSDLE